MKMETIVCQIENYLAETPRYLHSLSALELENKRDSATWSKKEILGHLIDSGINNLQRFTEVQYSEKPYNLRTYQQNELVEANNYQHADLDDLLSLWTSLNNRIISVISSLSSQERKLEIQKNGEPIGNLEFLIEDYARHMGHHVKQIGV
jgi:DinB superfamily